MKRSNAKRSFDSRFADAHQSIGFLLWKASNLHQRILRQALVDVDLTPTQFSVLACFSFLVSTKQRAVSQSEVCTHAGLDKMLVSQTVATLTARKLMVRRIDPQDRRAQCIEVTAQGQAVCNAALQAVEAADAQFFGKAARPEQLLSLLASWVSSHS
jgi:DNA-binding MarR family transcriptional regulator